jgi:hypothetical protein
MASNPLCAKPNLRGTFRSAYLVGALLAAALAVACGSDSGGSKSDASTGGDGTENGGSGNVGGANAGNGGSTPSANGGGTSGSAGNGGSVSNAGNSSNGGNNAAGGASNAGNTSAGGTSNSGGTNGANSGGTSGTSSGGKNSAGGTSSSGGNSSAGGVSGAAGASSSLDHEIQGVYCGNSTDAITQFEGWLGKPTGGILGYTGNASWSDFDGSVGWATGVWSALDRRVLWSIPLIPTGANLADAAAGMYDDAHYKKAAETLAKYRPQESVLYIRTGWEFNGDWFPWTAQGGKAKDFAGAFQHFVTAFRSVSTRFRFEWNVNLGDSGMNPEDAYPGDGYVDIIGMDFYWNLQYDNADPNMAWSSKLTQKYGLEWHQDFAATHHKPTAYSEWGIMSDKAGPYIQQAKAWFGAHDVVYQTYWNSNTSFTGMLSSGQYPNAGTAYKAAFGP